MQSAGSADEDSEGDLPLALRIRSQHGPRPGTQNGLSHHAESRRQPPPGTSQPPGSSFHRSAACRSQGQETRVRSPTGPPQPATHSPWQDGRPNPLDVVDANAGLGIGVTAVDEPSPSCKKAVLGGAFSRAGGGVARAGVSAGTLTMPPRRHTLAGRSSVGAGGRLPERLPETGVSPTAGDPGTLTWHDWHSGGLPGRRVRLAATYESVASWKERMGAALMEEVSLQVREWGEGGTAALVEVSTQDILDQPPICTDIS